MTNNNEKAKLLLDKLETLTKKQEDFSREISNLRMEINSIKSIETIQEEPKKETFPSKIDVEQPKEKSSEVIQQIKQPINNNPPLYSIPKTSKPAKAKSDIEKFIGENIINKIGIAITVIGVAIGAKYSIENNLISPLTRIILGYFIGIGLIGFGIKLKKNYEDFSAVLVSGAMAILYFITYSAYGIYELIPQTFAFGLMVIFTAFTVLAAITFNRQVIAHIGLVGAYAVPFLLSEGSGKVAVLFSYMAVINIGILVLSFKKYWKPLYFSSLWLTWLIFSSWYAFKYQTNEHFTLALVFLSIFFAIFYLTFLAYKLLRAEKFEIQDIFLLLANSFIFYGLGYAILNIHPTGQNLLGLFTLCNAIVHFVVSAVIYKKKLADRNLFYIVSGLVLVFITIAIPVQLNGNWVTLLWTGEAVLLFWIGRTKNVFIYEKLSYILMTLAFISIVQDWETFYGSQYSIINEFKITPIFNIHFLTSILFIGAFGFINFINRKANYPSALAANKDLMGIVSFLIPMILVFSVYYAFRIEIDHYFKQLLTDSTIMFTKDGENFEYMNYDLEKFKLIWIINYSLLFVTILSFINIKKLKNQQLGNINIGLNTFVIILFLTQGLYALSELRDTYLEQSLAEYYKRNFFNIGFRYVSYLFVSFTLLACYKYIRQDFIKHNFKVAFDLLLYVSILWIASSELITWLEVEKSAQSDKLGLSILWGIYSLLIICLGIWKNKKHLRIGAITLFGTTLLKLFFYDISHLDTIAKTIVFVSLGILLLIISFLYNKYKHFISDESKD